MGAILPKGMKHLAIGISGLKGKSLRTHRIFRRCLNEGEFILEKSTGQPIATADAIFREWFRAR